MASRMVTILGIMAHEVAHVAEMINDRIDVLLPLRRPILAYMVKVAMVLPIVSRSSFGDFISAVVRRDCRYMELLGRSKEILF